MVRGRFSALEKGLVPSGWGLGPSPSRGCGLGHTQGRLLCLTGLSPIVPLGVRDLWAVHGIP